MLKLTFLFLLTVTTTGFTQVTVTKADSLLYASGYRKSNYIITSIAETKVGAFISIQTFNEIESVTDGQTVSGVTTDQYLTFMATKEGLTPVPFLDGYRGFGYSPSKEVLIVGMWDKESMTDSEIETVFSYSINEGLLKKQGTYHGGVYGLYVKGDSMFVKLNVRNKRAGSRQLFIPFNIE